LLAFISGGIRKGTVAASYASSISLPDVAKPQQTALYGNKSIFDLGWHGSRAATQGGA
jgi:hypothetical protein